MHLAPRLVDALEKRQLLTVTGTQVDINTLAAGSVPSYQIAGNHVTLGDRSYFVATSADAGTELWVTDGTIAGTKIAANIVTGSASSTPRYLATFNGKLIFNAQGVNTASGLGTGAEPWIYDPSANGGQGAATLLKDINPHQWGTDPWGFTDAGNGKAFFTIYGGSQLWVTDGTEAGTTQVLDSTGAAVGSVPLWQPWAVIGGSIYFSRTTGTHGAELWKSDGTQAGTVRVTDVNPGSGSASPSNLFADGSYLYFSATNGTSGVEPYRLNTSSGVVDNLGDINAGAGGSAAWNFTRSGSRVFFIANNGSSGMELYAIDASVGSSSAALVKDVGPTSTGGLAGQQVPMADANGTLYFFGNDYWNGTELWKSDGTSAGTVMVTNLAPIHHHTPGWDGRQSLLAVGSQVYFSGTNHQTGQEVWRSDGTVAGTQLAANVAPGATSSNPINFRAVNGKLVFNADNGTSGVELWTIDLGGSAPVQLNPGHTGTQASNPNTLRRIGNDLFFWADNGLGNEPFKSDGTASGTLLLKDIWAWGANGNESSPLIELSPGVYLFAAADMQGYRELWKTDGTSAGTVRVRDINPGAVSSSPHSLVRLGSYVYFSADNGTSGRELWRSDGTSAGTTLVADIASGSSSSDPQSLTVFDGKLYFTATTSAGGRELWVSDGTAAGTTQVADIAVGATSSSPTSLTISGSTLHFIATTAAHGTELWSLAAGTSTPVVDDLTPGATGSSPRSLVNAAGTLYFNGKSNQFYDGALYAKQGTSGAQLTGNTIGVPDPIAAIGSTLFFVGLTSAGYELCKWDGTTSTLVKDIAPGAVHSSPSKPFVVDGKLYFSASNLGNGTELWVTDGTEAGTTLFADVNPGTGSSAPADFTRFGDRLIFSADNGASGRELWSVTLPQSNPPAPVGAINAGAITTSSTSVHIGWASNRPDLVSQTLSWSSNNGATWTTQSLPVTSSALSYHVTGLQPNTTYQFVLRPYLAEGPVTPTRYTARTLDAAASAVFTGTPSSDDIIIQPRLPLGILHGGGTSPLYGSRLGVSFNGVEYVFSTPAITGGIVVDGQDGDDYILYDDGFAHGTIPSLLVYAGSGNDTVVGGYANDWIDGGTGHDSLSGGGGDDSIYGQGGNDTLEGGDGFDQIYGFAGTDVLRVDGGDDDDLIVGGSGADYVQSEGGDLDIDQAGDLGVQLAGDALVETGAPYKLRLTLSRSATATIPAITGWTIRWGDGSIETLPLPSDAEGVFTATHVYSGSGYAVPLSAKVNFGTWSLDAPSLALDRRLDQDGRITHEFASGPVYADQFGGYFLQQGQTVRHYRGDGTADTTWGNGFGALVLPAESSLLAILAVPDGATLIAHSQFGYDDNGDWGGWVRVQKVTASGALDMTYGDTANTPGTASRFYAWANELARISVAARPDGSVVFTAPIWGLDVDRFNASGAFDDAFDGAMPAAVSYEYGIADLTTGPDGAAYVVLAGDQNWGESAISVARLTPSGSVDTTFAASGLLTTTFSATTDQYGAATVDAQGRLLLSPFTYDGTSRVMRYTTSGVPDATFGNAGIATSAGTPNYTAARSLLALNDGSIVLGTSTMSSGHILRFYKANGSPDTSRGTSGELRLNEWYLTGLAKDAFGRLLISSANPNATSVSRLGGLAVVAPIASTTSTTTEELADGSIKVDWTADVDAPDGFGVYYAYAPAPSNANALMTPPDLDWLGPIASTSDGSARSLTVSPTLLPPGASLLFGAGTLRPDGIGGMFGGLIRPSEEKTETKPGPIRNVTAETIRTTDRENPQYDRAVIKWNDRQNNVLHYKVWMTSPTRSLLAIVQPGSGAYQFEATALDPKQTYRFGVQPEFADTPEIPLTASSSVKTGMQASGQAVSLWAANVESSFSATLNWNPIQNANAEFVLYKQEHRKLRYFGNVVEIPGAREEVARLGAGAHAYTVKQLKEDTLYTFTLRLIYHDDRYVESSTQKRTCKDSEDPTRPERPERDPAPLPRPTGSSSGPSGGVYWWPAGTQWPAGAVFEFDVGLGWMREGGDGGIVADVETGQFGVNLAGYGFRVPSAGGTVKGRIRVVNNFQNVTLWSGSYKFEPGNKYPVDPGKASFEVLSAGETHFFTTSELVFPIIFDETYGNQVSTGAELSVWHMKDGIFEFVQDPNNPMWNDMFTGATAVRIWANVERGKTMAFLSDELEGSFDHGSYYAWTGLVKQLVYTAPDYSLDPTDGWVSEDDAEGFDPEDSSEEEDDDESSGEDDNGAQAKSPRPSGLTVVDRTDTTITLELRDNSKNEEGIEIERSADGRHWSRVAVIAGQNEEYTGYTLPNRGSGNNYRSISVTDSGLVPGTEYEYRARAFKWTKTNLPADVTQPFNPNTNVLHALEFSRWSRRAEGVTWHRMGVYAETLQAIEGTDATATVTLFRIGESGAQSVNASIEVEGAADYVRDYTLDTGTDLPPTPEPPPAPPTELPFTFTVEADGPVVPIPIGVVPDELFEYAEDVWFEVQPFEFTSGSQDRGTEPAYVPHQMQSAAVLIVDVVDLHVDTNNDGEIDALDTEEGDWEDLHEADADQGAISPVSRRDVDLDNIADFADFDGTAGLHFTPVRLTLGPVNNVEVDDIEFRFFYAENRPVDAVRHDRGVTPWREPDWYEPSALGSLRLWVVDADADRRNNHLRSIYLPHDEAVSADDLGLETGISRTIFVEAVQSPGVAVPIQVTARLTQRRDHATRVVMGGDTTNVIPTTANIGVNNADWSASQGRPVMKPDTTWTVDDHDEVLEDAPEDPDFPTGEGGMQFWWSRPDSEQQSGEDNERFAGRRREEAEDLLPIAIDLTTLPVDHFRSGNSYTFRLTFQGFQNTQSFRIYRSVGEQGLLEHLEAPEAATAILNGEFLNVSDPANNFYTSSSEEDFRQLLIRAFGPADQVDTGSIVVEARSVEGQWVTFDSIRLTFRPIEDFWAKWSLRTGSGTNGPNGPEVSYPTEDGRVSNLRVYGPAQLANEQGELGSPNRLRDGSGTSAPGVFDLGATAPTPLPLSEDESVLVFLHGYNTPDQDGSETSSTFYRRLFWTGYRGQLLGMMWHGDEDRGGPFRLYTPFNTNLINAFQTAYPLVDFLRGQLLPAVGGDASRINLAGHSMGNLVMFEALRLNNVRGQRGDFAQLPVANNAFAAEAAVWREAFEPESALVYNQTPGYVGDPFSYSVDEQKRMSWRFWFRQQGENGEDDSVRPSLQGRIYNSYNPLDLALFGAMRSNDYVNVAFGDFDNPSPHPQDGYSHYNRPVHRAYRRLFDASLFGSMHTMPVLMSERTRPTVTAQEVLDNLFNLPHVLKFDGISNYNVAIGASQIDWAGFVVNVNAHELGWYSTGHGHAFYTDYSNGPDWLNVDVGQKDGSLTTIWNWYRGVFFPAGGQALPEGNS